MNAMDKEKEVARLEMIALLRSTAAAMDADPALYSAEALGLFFSTMISHHAALLAVADVRKRVIDGEGLMLCATDVGPRCDGCGTTGGKGMWTFTLDAHSCVSDENQFVVIAQCVLCSNRRSIRAHALECSDPAAMRAVLERALSVSCG